MQQSIRVAAVGDLHYETTSQGHLQALFAQVNELADVLVLCGDLTDSGLPEEAQILASDLAAVNVPIVAVLGNHDYEAGYAAELRQIFSAQGVTMLDGEACEIRGVGFAGAKGFAGGFGRGMLKAFGEPAIKQFVQEAVDETRKLETALAQLQSPHKIAVLHYAPIQATVEGEPPILFPYLGCSRLEEPINRYPVAAVVHGHAHYGSPAGQTRSGIPVYNVALALLRATQPDQPPLRLIELPC